ncbi:MAG: hypothetical protein V1929_07820 [bacterium]
MIPIDDISHATKRTAVTDFLVSEMAGTLGACDDAHTAAAEAVAAYWTTHCPDTALDSDFILLLVSRALSFAGDDDAARHWLEQKSSHLAGGESLLPLVTSRDCTMASLASVSSRLVRPEHWSFADRESAWVLDCGHVVLDRTAETELVCFRALRSLIEGVEFAWDATGGRGVLGLRQSAALARRVVGPGSSRNRIRALCADMEAFCSQVLAASAKRRGWTAVPSVVHMDIG